MKTMCPIGYQHNDVMATHALEHMTRDLRLHIASANEVKSAQQVKQGA